MIYLLFKKIDDLPSFSSFPILKASPPLVGGSSGDGFAEAAFEATDQ